MSASASTGLDSSSQRLREDAAPWQELEWGHYAADLPIWDALARPGKRVLELGCGSGRVALHLAARDREVVAVDHDASLLTELGNRAARLQIDVRCVVADAMALRLGERFETVLAPLQLANVIHPADRAGLLRSARLHLRPGGSFALSFLTEADARELVRAYEAVGPTRELAEPDVIAVDGSIYSSRPLELSLAAGVRVKPSLDRERPGELSSDGAVLIVRRHRVVAHPDGARREELHEDRFHLFRPDVLEREAAAEKLTLRERQRVAQTTADAATTVLVFELVPSEALPKGVGDE